MTICFTLIKGQNNNFSNKELASLAVNASKLASVLGSSEIDNTSNIPENLLTLDNASLLSYNIPSSAPGIVMQKGDIIKYTVKTGDSLSVIAQEHNISLNTLLWTNKLTNKSKIKPGQKLEILPISGIKHTVKNGENVSSIAKKYGTTVNEIMVFNNLPADAFISIGDNLVIPGGKMPKPAKPRYTSKNYYTSSKNVRGPGTGKSHVFVYGQCTWYVAQKRIVPWSGHAKSWLTNAQVRGYSVCWGSKCSPQVGAIVSLMSSTWLSKLYGHVAYVEKVSGNQFLISEMNYIGWNKVSTRWLAVGDYRIKGYIY